MQCIIYAVRLFGGLEWSLPGFHAGTRPGNKAVKYWAAQSRIGPEIGLSPDLPHSITAITVETVAQAVMETVQSQDVMSTGPNASPFHCSLAH